jgi:hypothetical protein
MKALSLVSCLVLAGCAIDEELDLSESTHAIKNNPGDDGTCPEWGCGSNSPMIALANFHDLFERDVPNAAGFRIKSFQKEYPAASGIWRSYWPEVEHGKLRAVTRTAIPIVAWQNADVIGMRFVIENAQGAVIHLYVDDISGVPFWSHPPNWSIPHGRMAMTYELRWIYPNSAMRRRVPICGASTEADGIYPFNAVLFEDDEIDADALRVVGDAASQRFNIGCKGHTLAKMHLLGHTKAGGYYMGTTPTINQRTAMLKMLSGDYCGLGDPFTVAGVDLEWKDAQHWYDNVSSQVIEARWDENGATCLNTPRVDYQGGDPRFPNGVEALLDESAGWCTTARGNPRPLSCYSSNTDSFAGGYLISVNAGAQGL